MSSHIDQKLLEISKRSNNAVLGTLKGQIFTIEMNRKDKLNAFNQDIVLGLTECFLFAQAVDEILVVILTGGYNYKYFTAGNDLAQFSHVLTASIEEKEKIFSTAVSRFSDLLRSMYTLNKPIIAAINGPGVGFGVTVMGLCDFIYAVEKATFFAPFSQLGISAEGCSTYFFPKMIGSVRANEILLLGKKLSAKEYQEYGLINGTVANGDELQKVVTDVAIKLSQFPPGSISATKRLIRTHNGSISELDKVAQVEGEELKRRFLSDEALQAIIHFNTKKSPASSSSNNVIVEGFISSAIFQQLASLATNKLVDKVGAIFQFNLKNKNGKEQAWIVDLKNKPASVRLANPSTTNQADCTLLLSDDTFTKMMLGKIGPEKAFMTGMVKSKGSLKTVMKLMPLAKEITAVAKARL